MKTIDLTTCVPGQKLRLRNGDTVTYLSNKGVFETFPHKVLQNESRVLELTDKGNYWADGSADSDDVVEIIPLVPIQKVTIEKEPKTEPFNESATKKTENKLQILLKKRGSRYQFKVISQPESFRNPKDNEVIKFRVSNGFEFASCRCPSISDDGTSAYLWGEYYFKDNDSQLISLSEEQVKTIRESVKLFNQEYDASLVSGRPVDSKSKAETLEQITKEYQESINRALDVYKAKINNLIAGISF